jgi:hypothetical protein
MDITDKFNEPCPHHPGYRRCYVVCLKRLAKDHFTEPIRNSEWECRIENDARPLGPGWITPGGEWEFHHYHNRLDPSYKWSGRIEKQLVEGESLKGWQPPKKP